MVTDIFVKIDDIKGESQDPKHKDEIEVLSWKWGMSQNGTAHLGAGAGGGKVSVRDLTFAKYVDRASPNLVKFCCSGRHFKKALLTMRKAGGSPIEYVKVELFDGIVSGLALAAGRGNARPMENVTLKFSSFKWEYTPQTASGAAGGAIPALWNIAKNSES